MHSIDSLLPVIAKKLTRGAAKRTDPDLRLYPVHRLDKETTGVMLLAKTEEMARHLHRMFIRHEVVKKYWVVTVGVPDPKDGVIDIPMAEVDVGGFHRMGIRPDIGAVYKDMGKFGRGKGTAAVTNFRVVSENGSAALVEVNPETGKGLCVQRNHLNHFFLHLIPFHDSCCESKEENTEKYTREKH